MRRPPPRLGPLRQMSSGSDKSMKTPSLRHERDRDEDLLLVSTERHCTPPGSVHGHQTNEMGSPDIQNMPRSLVRLIDMDTNSIMARDGDVRPSMTERITDAEACESPKEEMNGAEWKWVEPPMSAVPLPETDPPNREPVQTPGAGVIFRENATSKPPLLRLTSQSSSIRKSTNFRELSTHTIRGSVHIQMPVHFLWYGLLLGVANIHWIDTLRGWTLLVYFFSSFCVVQIRRLIVQLDPVSIIPLYLSYVPYAIFHLLAREAHMIFGVLWFLSSIIMNMQNGSAKLRHHVIGSMMTFIAVYVSCTLVQYGLYTQSTGEKYYMFSPLKVHETSGTKAPWEDAGVLAQEITFLISIVLLGGALCMLHRFIKIYAVSLIDRGIRVHDLYLANLELRRQLKGMSLDATKLDLDSPITKVIQNIRNIQYMRDTDPEVAQNLDFVVQILSSNQLFVPDIKKGDRVDNEVLLWLKTMMMTKNGSGERNVDIAAQDIHLNNSNPMQSITLTVPAGISSNDAELFEYLDENMLKWDFDVFEFARMTDGRPLFYIGYKIFANEGFAAQYQIEDATIRKFLTKIEKGYLPNPYHNSLHAADVLQTVYFFLVNFQMREFMTIDDVFSTVFAAIVHDVDHPGVNSNFLINSRSPLAILYNDTAVLENHHCSKAFEYVLSDPKCNIFANIRIDKFKLLRGNIISMVMATDMTRHFEYITKFRNKIAGAGFDFSDQKERQLLMDFAIKCADVSNPTKSLGLYKKWVDVIFAEFFEQGDQEKMLKIPVTMFMDRTTTSIPKSQIGFIDFVIMPLYEAWHTYNDEESYLPMQNLKDNREYWKVQLDEEISNQLTTPPNVEATPTASNSLPIPPP